jgi:hypothetical protein
MLVATPKCDQSTRDAIRSLSLSLSLSHTHTPHFLLTSHPLLIGFYHTHCPLILTHMHASHPSLHPHAQLASPVLVHLRSVISGWPQTYTHDQGTKEPRVYVCECEQNGKKCVCVCVCCVRLRERRTTDHARIPFSSCLPHEFTCIDYTTSH